MSTLALCHQFGICFKTRMNTIYCKTIANQDENYIAKLYIAKTNANYNENYILQKLYIAKQA